MQTIGADLEIKACSVAVTKDTVVLTVRDAKDRAYLLTMSHLTGGKMAEQIKIGLESLQAVG